MADPTGASSRRLAPAIAAYLCLFLGGAVAGLVLAGWLAPDSWVAEFVSFLALPTAFAAGLQTWYGLALIGLIPRLLRRWTGPSPSPGVRRDVTEAPLAGAVVFLPFSSAAGAVAGIVAAVVSAHPPWVVVPAYWLVGTLHGLLAWRLARRGILMPPESG